MVVKHMEKMNKRGNLDIGELILLVVALVFGLALVPTLNNAATAAANNSSGAAATLYGLFPLIFVAILVVAAVGYVYKKYKK